ncbi:MAG: YaaC family protein [Burkholderiales bacterium]
MKEPSNITNFVRWFSVPRLKPRQLQTTSNVAEEIFAALCHIADVPEVGKEFLTKKGIAKEKVDETYFAMHSFIRQSKAFYFAAQGSGTRAGPLNYYYAFLNLAKALLCLTHPDRVKGRIGHGLTHDLTAAPLESQVVVLKEGGVFGLLYEVIAPDKLPTGFRTDLLSLLAYCPDISQEVTEAKGAEHQGMSVLSRGVSDKDKKLAFGWLGISRFNVLEGCESAKANVLSYFDEIKMSDTSLAREVFGLYGEAVGNFRFFETKEKFPTEGTGIPIRKLEEICFTGLERYVLENPYFGETEPDCLLFKPLVQGKEIPFNSIVAAYAVFYVLSSLSRYHPLYFEQAVSSRDSWIIDSFVRSVPITLLRYFTNRFFGENRQYVAR